MSRTATVLLATMLISLPAGAAHVTVPGTLVSMDVPAGFMPMPKSVIDNEYSCGSAPPTTMYSMHGPH